jgi:hypothetical protein
MEVDGDARGGVRVVGGEAEGSSELVSGEAGLEGAGEVVEAEQELSVLKGDRGRCRSLGAIEQAGLQMRGGSGDLESDGDLLIVHSCRAFPKTIDRGGRGGMEEGGCEQEVADKQRRGSQRLTSKGFHRGSTLSGCMEGERMQKETLSGA